MPKEAYTCHDCCLELLASGLSQVDMAELGRALSAVHRAIYSRLSASITACDTPGLFPLPPGHAGPEFIARLFDLERFAQAQGIFSVNHYQNEVGAQNEKIGTFPRQKKSAVESKTSTPFNPYRSLQADRLKLSGKGEWPAHDFIEDELRLPFLEPSVLELPGQKSSIGPSFKFEDKDEYLKLARLWDARGLLCIFDEEPRFFCRVFNCHKNDTTDRQIGDRRWWNCHEMHSSGPSAFLPNGPLVCSLHCPPGFLLRGCVSDRKDFYHQCAASRSRAFTNCLPFSFSKNHFKESPAFAELIAELGKPTSRATHGDRYGMPSRKIKRENDLQGIFVGFRSLFQGDHLGVEYALSARQTMLQRAGL